MEQYLVALRVLKDIERILEISPDNVDRVDYYRAGKRIRVMVSAALRHMLMLDEKMIVDAVHLETGKEGFDYDQWLVWHEKWCKEHREEIEDEWMEYYRRS